MSALSLSSSEQILYDYMMGFVGIPYRYGGDVPADGGIDCSGLVLLYLQAAGKWPHGQDASAQGIFDGLRVKGHALFKPGDDYFPMAFGHLAIYGSAGSLASADFSSISRYRVASERGVPSRRRFS